MLKKANKKQRKLGMTIELFDIFYHLEKPYT